MPDKEDAVHAIAWLHRVEQRPQAVDGEAARKTVVDAYRAAQDGGDDVCRLRRAQFRRADDGVRAKPDAAEERCQALGLTDALGRERTLRVIASPALGVAGIGVAQ